MISHNNQIIEPHNALNDLKKNKKKHDNWRPNIMEQHVEMWYLEHNLKWSLIAFLAW